MATLPTGDGARSESDPAPHGPGAGQGHAGGHPPIGPGYGRSSHRSERTPLDGTVLAALVITLIALLSWALFQTFAIFSERQALERAVAGQQQQIDASTKVRQQLDAIAAGMQKLAAGGNASARLVVEELRRRGVTISVNPGATPPVPAPPSSPAPAK